jgi:hypothetical protein
MHFEYNAFFLANAQKFGCKTKRILATSARFRQGHAKKAGYYTGGPEKQSSPYGLGNR